MTVNQVVSPRLVRVQGASPPWLARLSIDTPVINPARILADLHRDIRKFKQHRFSVRFTGISNKTGESLKFADGTERCEIRRDAYTMGGNGVLAREDWKSGTRRDRWCLASIQTRW